MNYKKSFLVLLVSTGLMWGCSNQGSSEGDKFFESGQYQEAVDAFSERLATKPKDANDLYKRGRAYEEMGDLESAKKDFEAGYKQDPKNTQILLSLSNLYQKEGNFERSLLYAGYAVEVPGAPATAYFMKGRALHQMGKTDEALDEYSTAIQIDDQYGQAYYYRGVLKYATKKTRSACEDFRLASGHNYKQADEALEKYCK
ncbi:tetratricopeptide repeat protein [Echinicola marina]|uniref:tetratricopeptide repeat protein n=1 Tax=Echinicola marina TaxID=2859768 RepID=UPI001CF68FB0|nr:tetratricopeptide repeat protein [Echinicola marina]UCS92609.1 tetratricopeptide repeat protein [Echinicola marina]